MSRDTKCCNQGEENEDWDLIFGWVYSDITDYLGQSRFSAVVWSILDYTVFLERPGGTICQSALQKGRYRIYHHRFQAWHLQGRRWGALRTCCLSAEHSMSCNTLDSPCEQSSKLEGEGVEGSVSAGRSQHGGGGLTILLRALSLAPFPLLCG